MVVSMNKQSSGARDVKSERRAVGGLEFISAWAVLSMRMTSSPATACGRLGFRRPGGGGLQHMGVTSGAGHGRSRAATAVPPGPLLGCPLARVTIGDVGRDLVLFRLHN